MTEQCLGGCPVGTYAREDMQCVGCSDHCSSCSSFSQCSQCSTGFNLVNGYCTVDCPTGTYPVLASCPSCPADCPSCSHLVNCTSCIPDSYLFTSTALQMTTCMTTCPTTFYPDPSGWCLKCPSTCVSCTNSTSCTQCISGHILTSGICTN